METEKDFAQRIELGLEFPDYIEWHDWSPRREYHKAVVIKNNYPETQTLWYDPVSSPYFELTYREPIRLNHGINGILGVVFKPIKFQLYESNIKFFTQRGNFVVSLRGIPPNVLLKIPTIIDFGYCTVNDITERKFIINNLGEVPMSIEWKVKMPYNITPIRAFLQPGERISACAAFGPINAGPSKAVAYCVSSDGPELKMEMSGTAKHSFLELPHTYINFDGVPIRSTKELYMQILNTSDVKAKYHIRRADDPSGGSACPFVISPSKGIIPPKSSVWLKVTFTPISAGTHSLEYFDLITPQMSSITFSCAGYGARPAVWISAFSIDFGSVKLGGHSSSSLFLENRSNVPVAYQFVTEELGAYNFVKSKGILGAHCKVMLTIIFRPTVPVNYYKRVTCLLDCHFPLYCDLVGSCYEKMVGFSTLLSFHIHEHREYLRRKKLANVNLEESYKLLGQGFENLFNSDNLPTHSPELDILDEKKEPSLRRRESRKTLTPRQGFGVQSASGEQRPTSSVRKRSWNAIIHSRKSILFQETKGNLASEVWREYFLGRIEGWDPVSIDHTHLDFGACAYSHIPDMHIKHIVLRNNTAGQVFCFWTSAYSLGHACPEIGGSDFSVFKVTPRKAEILAGSAFTFTVKFLPSRENMYYSQCMNCYVHLDRRIQVAAPYILPPWSAAIALCGHSFIDMSKNFLPQAAFSATNIIFPPALQGTLVYQTVMLYNQARTSLRFEFEVAGLPSEFRVKPMEGVVEGHDVQIISFLFEAREPNTYTTALCCKLNNTSSIVLMLSASSHAPQVKFEPGSSICFKPTNLGKKEAQTIVIANICSIPVRFKWIVPKKFTGIFKAVPASGVLVGKGKAKVSCIFRPLRKQYYSFQVSCSIAACLETAICRNHTIESRRHAESQYKYILLDVTGEGTAGFLVMKPRNLNFGVLSVGSLTTHSIRIFNSSIDILDYSLSHVSLTGDNKGTYRLSFDSPTGQVPAHSHIDVHAAFEPNCATDYFIKIICKTVFDKKCRAGKAVLHPESTCLVKAVGAYPSLIITGVRSQRLSSAHLWEQLQINRLNRALSVEPTDSNQQGRSLFCVGKSLDSFCPLELTFGAQALGKITTIDLVLECRVDVPVAWKIRIWNDKEVDTEHWFDEGNLLQGEDQLMMVWKLGLFDVVPRQGKIDPGKQVHVKLTYRHELEGSHALPAILEVENGLSIELCLTGSTYHFTERLLGFQSSTYSLMPLTIGNINPPLQTFELRNDGDLGFAYKVDMTSLDGSATENFGFHTLTCLNASGHIPPMQTALLNWLFQPLEAKEYSYKIYIDIDDGKRYPLTIYGLGLPANDNSRFGFHSHPYGKSYAYSGLVAMISSEFLDFGKVPELSACYKLVTIQNLSDSVDISFMWQKSLAADDMLYGNVSVFPESGTVMAGKHCLCKVKFVASVEPQISLITMHCKIKVLKYEEPREKLPAKTVEDVYIDNERRYGYGTYEKQFLHKSVVPSRREEQSRLSAYQNTSRESPLDVMPPDTMLFLTLGTHVCTTQKFHSTSEHASTWFRPSLKSSLIPSVHRHQGGKDQLVDIVLGELMEKCLMDDSTGSYAKAALVQTVLRELLEESLIDEINNLSFDSFDDKKSLYFEEFQTVTIDLEEESDVTEYATLEVEHDEIRMPCLIGDTSNVSDNLPLHSKHAVDLKEMIAESGQKHCSKRGGLLPRIFGRYICSHKSEAPVEEAIPVADKKRLGRIILEDVLFEAIKEYFEEE